MSNQFAVKFCDTCEGTGKIIRDYHGNPTYIASHYGDPEFPVFVEEAHSPSPCTSCKGFVYYNRHQQPYKTLAMAKRMREQGKAKKCHHCDDDGNTWNIPAKQKCWDCGGTGLELVYDAESTVIPFGIDIYKYGKHDFIASWANDLTITIIRNSGELSWGESFLGLNSIMGCTDYGAMASLSDEEAVADVRERLRNGSFQMISLCDKETRALSREVIVKIRANGYTLVAAGKNPGGYALPPAYDAIVDLPVSVASSIIGNQ